jgi:hypothetical protein
MPCSRSDQRLAVAAVALFLALTQPTQVLAHAKGLDKTQAEAEQRAAATPWAALKASSASGGWRVDGLQRGAAASEEQGV